jgi:hypothetical protein
MEYTLAAKIGKYNSVMYVSAFSFPKVQTECPLFPADSTDRRNTCGKLFCWRIVAQSFSQSFIKPSRDGNEMVLVYFGQIHAFREVLSQQSVDLLI